MNANATSVKNAKATTHTNKRNDKRMVKIDEETTNNKLKELSQRKTSKLKTWIMNYAELLPFPIAGFYLFKNLTFAIILIIIGVIWIIEKNYNKR